MSFRSHNIDNNIYDVRFKLHQEGGVADCNRLTSYEVEGDVVNYYLALFYSSQHGYHKTAPLISLALSVYLLLENLEGNV